MSLTTAAVGGGAAAPSRGGGALPSSWRALAVVLLASACGTGCAFIESATEQTIGEGQIDALDEQIMWPTVDEMTGLTTEQVASIPGFPTSLNDGTFAHLQGALTLSGDCHVDQEVAGFEDNPQILDLSVGITSCQNDGRCATRCPESWRGMIFKSEVELQLVTPEMAAEIREQLSQLTPDAIVQIRFLVHELELFQEDEAGETQSIHPWIEDFALVLRDEEDNEVTIIRDRDLDSISPETPQRFDVDVESEFTRHLKDGILAGEAVAITVSQGMRVPQYNLYDVKITGAGLELKIQPEIVVSVVEVVKSKISE